MGPPATASLLSRTISRMMLIAAGVGVSLRVDWLDAELLPGNRSLGNDGSGSDRIVFRSAHHSTGNRRPESQGGLMTTVVEGSGVVVMRDGGHRAPGI